MNVLKTRKKRLVTLDIGKFWAVEKVLQCPEDKNVYTSEPLRALAPNRCTYGFDVIVYIGFALFVHCRSDRDIVKQLAKRNIYISERQIGYLGEKFITYLSIVHSQSKEKLKNIIYLTGGYILQLDGTCEGDSPHLFIGIDGISEIVLENIKLPSEKAELLIPFFKKIKKQYGIPIGLVHDMGRGILAAVEEVFPIVPDFICHFHFLRDIGKDLLEEEYSKIRNILKNRKFAPYFVKDQKYLKKS